MNPTQEQLDARIRDSGQTPYTAPISVSSLGSGMNTAQFPTAPNNTSQFNSATAGAIAGAATPGVPAPVTTPVPEAPVPEAKTGLASFLEKYLPGGVKTTAPVSSVNTYEELAKKNKLVETQNEVNDLTAQLNSSAAQTTAAQLDLETGGNTPRVQGTLDRMQGQIARENAIRDLPIAARLNAAQGRLRSAEANISTMLGLIQKDNEAQYNFEKDKINYALQFATADQATALQEKKDKLDEKKRAEDKLEELKKGFINAAINSKDFNSASKLAAATTYEEIAKLSKGIKGNNLDDIYKELQIEKLRQELGGGVGVKTNAAGQMVLKTADAQKVNKEIIGTDAYKAIVKAKDSLQFLSEFEKKFSQTGATSAVFSPRQNADLKTKYNSTILNLKEFFNLGVLNGPDETILRGIVPDPTNKSAALTVGSLGIYKPSAATKAGIENMKTQINQTLDERYKNITSQYSAYDPESVTVLKDVQRTFVESKVKLDPKVAKLKKENPTLSDADIISILGL